MTHTKLLVAFLESVQESENGGRIDPARFPLITAALELARLAATVRDPRFWNDGNRMVRGAAEKVFALIPEADDGALWEVQVTSDGKAWCDEFGEYFRTREDAEKSAQGIRDAIINGDHTATAVRVIQRERN